ncbi:MAG: hypothetical protein QG599_2573, partial [Pseudomonadota bacterium]|nr:hypothetical protein [Pseudomonadota bacterium]
PVASMDHLAGLLENHSERHPTPPNADPDQPSLSERFRDLAKKLRASQADDEDRAIQAEQAEREDLNAKKAQIESHRNERMRRAA